MLFNSLSFVVFFPVAVCCYWFVLQRYRWILLLATSYFFYMCWEPKYIGLIILSTIVDYIAGKWIYLAKTERLKVSLLITSLCVNLGLLAIFKYLGLFCGTLNLWFSFLKIPIDIPILNLLLPVGISFYTFQTLSYTIDVYRGKIKPETHLGYFALYVAYWPQLVAGPIERPDRLLPQLHKPFVFTCENASIGFHRMLLGFFKKIVIADNLGLYVNWVYSNIGEHNLVTILCATYLFAIQIYCDFSGYSDIAIGASKFLGIDLMENFRMPYMARTITDFWKRWHISLTTWFKDYIYIPIGGSRNGAGCWYRNIMIVFLVSGFWHGASWTFVLWGGVHACLFFIERQLKSLGEKLNGTNLSRVVSICSNPLLQHIYLVNVVVITWIFFRVNSFSDLNVILSTILDGNIFPLHIPINDRFAIVMGVVSGMLLIVTELITTYAGRIRGLYQLRYVRWSMAICIILWILNFGQFYNPSQFVYFQF